VRLAAERWDDLKEVNDTVNREIAPERNELGLAGETFGSSTRVAANAMIML
jgi:predicted transglutaminase-like cysteine proteinase